MDSDQKLKQLLSLDLPSLGTYYREMSALEGYGVLVVNYYPSGEAAQMSAKYLKPNQIGRLARQMGLSTLQLEFSQHNQHSQMVVAVITAETKGVVTVELPSLDVETTPANTPETQAQTYSAPSSKRKSASKTTTQRKSPTKSTPKRQNEEKQSQTETPLAQTGVAKEPTAESETAAQPSVESETVTRAIAQSETTSKPAAKRKSSLK